MSGPGLKDGVILFGERNQVGLAHHTSDGVNNIDNPNIGGISSFIVIKGTWSLYSEVRGGGHKIAIDGVTDFKPGLYSFDDQHPGDKTAKSVQKS